MQLEGMSVHKQHPMGLFGDTSQAGEAVRSRSPSTTQHKQRHVAFPNGTEQAACSPSRAPRVPLPPGSPQKVPRAAPFPSCNGEAPGHSAAPCFPGLPTPLVPLPSPATGQVRWQPKIQTHPNGPKSTMPRRWLVQSQPVVKTFLARSVVSPQVQPTQTLKGSPSPSVSPTAFLPSEEQKLPYKTQYMFSCCSQALKISILLSGEQTAL